MKASVEKIYSIIGTDSQLQTLLGGSGKITPMITDKFENFPCVTYEVIDGSFRTVPKYVEDLTMEFRIWVKARPDGGSMGLVEDIHSRINTLLNYYSEKMNPVVYVRLDFETYLPETDRQLYSKLVRYRIWTHE